MNLSHGHAMARNPTLIKWDLRVRFPSCPYNGVDNRIHLQHTMCDEGGISKKAAFRGSFLCAKLIL